jgi:hypothetical protein
MAQRHSKNSKPLKDFESYCKAHPGERFWQALRNWSGEAFIFAGDLSVKLPEGLHKSHPFTVDQARVLVESLGLRDTFSREEK